MCRRLMPARPMPALYLGYQPKRLESAPRLAAQRSLARQGSIIAVALAVCGLSWPLAGVAQAEVTAEQVRRALDRGATFLLEQQRTDGSWAEMSGYRGGVGALCTLALLNAGVEVGDQRMQKALRYLRTITPEKTYVVALQTMVLARAEPDADRALIQRNVEWLESTQVAKGPSSGAWSYPNRGGTGGDPSNSQFALLALHEAERVGVSASGMTWRQAGKYWEGCQNKDGSWGYMGSPGTGSMTCAGIASLVIAHDHVHPGDARAADDRVECCAARPAGDADRVARALQWMGQNYSVERNPGHVSWTLYYLYGLERAGRLTGRRFLQLPLWPAQTNRADWYRDGADDLVRDQDGLTGLWMGARVVGNVKGGNRWRHSEEPLIGTSFALLFLSKGRWPTLLAKMLYCDSDDWNRHRHDAANLTRYVESRWKRDLTWQVIDLRTASVDDLIQTPVLHFCGSRSPLPKTPATRRELAQKLRDYLGRGGFLMAEADCGGAGFDRGFRDLMAAAFPEPEYKLRLLEPEHPIWHAEEIVDPQQLRPLWGIDFDCRTSVVYAPPDPPDKPRPSLSCLWELSRPGRGVRHSPAVQAQTGAALSLGINVLAYATNRELKTKEDFFRPTSPPPPGDRVERGRLDVANLRHPGGCNVAPRALSNLMDAAGCNLKIRARARPEPLDITDAALFDYHLVFMHGRTAFRLTDDERRQLKLYVERGGMLLADSICASRAFSESFRREMAAAFSDRRLEAIPAGDPLWSTAYGGFDLQTVWRRDPAAAGPGQPLQTAVRKVAPELEGIEFDDRWGVVFSPHDLSCALERQNAPDCPGYTREDAARIGINVVLYSLQK